MLNARRRALAGCEAGAMSGNLSRAGDVKKAPPGHECEAYRADKHGYNACKISAMHILIVEDDEVARDYLAKALREVGHTVDVAADGLAGLHMASSIAIDVAIVDRMLPKLDGLALVQSLRATGRKLPVLILSALGEVDDRITGLRAGGDDYLTKPYHVAELLARVDALARRGESGDAESHAKLKLADLELDRMTRRVTRNGKKIELTAREFQLLEFMMRHSGQVVTRTMLLEGVWDYHFDPQTNVIDVHISRLRQAIDKDFEKPLLHTVRGAGYSLREDE
jgi:two-component system OmpR family response regulator